MGKNFLQRKHKNNKNQNKAGRVLQPQSLRYPHLISLIPLL